VKAINTNYAGRFFRSRTEARWAVFFDACGISWTYEAEGYELRGGRYLPDFWLPVFGVYFEVKGEQPTEAERAKCLELAEESGRAVLLAVGAPEERFQIRWFDASGEEDTWYAIARDKNPAAGLWLVDERELDRGDLGASRWFGGGDLEAYRGGPMFSGALEQAYDVAMGMRFEHGSGRQRIAPIEETDPSRLQWGEVVKFGSARA